MNQNAVLIEKTDHIGIITLNRPESINTFNVPLATELNQALKDLDEDEDTRVVIIRGQEKASVQELM